MTANVSLELGGDSTAASAEPPCEHMAWIPGGTFRMVFDAFYPEERPAHWVSVAGFWMDRHPVTNAEFRPLRRGDRLRDLGRAPAGPATVRR